MANLTSFELEREANIARNKELLAQLGLQGAINDLGIPKKESPAPKAKPVQPAKRVKRETVEPNVPRRQSTRLRKEVIDPNETPAQRRKREAELEERRAKEAEEALAEEIRQREAKKPRHYDLDFEKLLSEEDQGDLPSLRSCMQSITDGPWPKRIAEEDAFIFDDEVKEEAALTELRDSLSKLKVVARAKVTKDRVYSGAYHPDRTKDLIFFGDKHGQLGIWDARASQDETLDADGEQEPESKEQGKYWRLQVHWPASSVSSISAVKFDPIDSHSLYTSAYDCTVRSLSFTSGISREVYATSDRVLISSFDLPPNGHEMWISDVGGGLTHLDLREDRSKAKRFEVSEQKIGCVSVNPRHAHLLVTSSNSRALQIWDTRKLVTFADGLPDDMNGPRSSSSPAPDSAPGKDIDAETVATFLSSSKGKGCLKGEWKHDKSVSSAYWDPRGISIVSTSYDDSLRLWEFDSSKLKNNSVLPSSRPFSRIKHDCQTGRWLTIFKAQWSPNPDVYPHFTVGNMQHSLDIFSCKGDLITRLSDRQTITAVQAVTLSHPSVLERVASGNASGRCVLWSI